eukprot:scaffold17636_cov120-Isochrysis_galbana.AAC.2
MLEQVETYRLLLDGRKGEELQGGRPAERLALHAAHQQPCELRRVVRRECGWRSTHDLHDERRLRGRVAKWVLERAQFAQQYTERPDVRLLVVRVAVAQLRREVARRPDNGLSHVARGIEPPRHSKVPDLDDVAFTQENVVRF